MTDKPKELIERVRQRNPDIEIYGGKRMKEDIFIILGRAILKDVSELYLTSHTPERGAPETSYRLWTERPKVLGHPGWDEDIAIGETWLKTQADEQMLEKLIGRFPYPNIDRMVGGYCEETRTYQLK